MADNFSMPDDNFGTSIVGGIDPNYTPTMDDGQEVEPIAPMGGGMSSSPTPTYQQYKQQKEEKGGGGWLQNVGDFFRSVPAFEVVRNAARNDPSTFYSVLSQLALTNPQGVRDVMGERAAGIRQEEERLATQRWRQQQLQSDLELKQLDVSRRAGEKEDMYVDRVRARATNDGVLGDFETQYGIVDDRRKAETLERWVSDKRALEKDKQTGLAILRTQQKTPGLKLTGKALELYEKDPNFASVWDAQAAQGEEKAVLAAQKRVLDTQILQARLSSLTKALAKSSQVLSLAQKYDWEKQKIDLRDLHREIMSLEDEVAKNELLVGSGWLPKEMEETLKGKQDVLTEKKAEYERKMDYMEMFIATLDGGQIVEPPPGTGGSEGDVATGGDEEVDTSEDEDATKGLDLGFDFLDTLDKKEQEEAKKKEKEAAKKGKG